MASTGSDTARPARRAQSETVGVILLTGVIVVTAALVGTAATARFVQQADTGGAPGDAEVTVTADNLTITHAGGNPIADGDVEVVIGNGSYEEQYSLTDAVARTGDGDGRFEAGETAVFNHGFSPGEVTIRVIDRGSNTVVRQADRTVPTDEPANFTVRVDNTNSPVTEGERLKVRATIENTGDRRATQNISLTINGTQEDTQRLTLDGGESEQVTLTWDTASGDAGTYTATVSSANDSASTSVQVLTPANFNVTIDGTNSPIVEGETLLVNATVENTGESSDIQIIRLAVDDPNDPNPVDFTYLGLGGGENKSLTLEWSSTSGDGGPGRSSNSYTVTVSSYDSSDSDTVEVEGSGGGGGPPSGGGPPGGGPPGQQ